MPASRSLAVIVIDRVISSEGHRALIAFSSHRSLHPAITVASRGRIVIALVALHAALGTALLVGGSRLGGRSAWIGLIAPAATMVWLAFQLGGVLDGEAVAEHIDWVPELGLGVDVLLDGFGALMLLLVSGIGVLIFVYAARYFSADDGRAGRLIGLLTLFSGAMVGLVVADNLLVLYGFWELTSVTSFLLIGNDHERRDARGAALQALLVTGAGALAMLAGFLVLGNAAGTYRLSAILDDPPSGTAVGVALMLILGGAFTKSAQYPFHSWLPRAMAAPTPVSAYLHSATMVKAGVYLIARLSPAFADQYGWWSPVVVGVGLTTMVCAGVRALRQDDLKLLLAFGTVSQLGFMVAVFGVGTAEAVAAGSVLLLAHGAYKATNFMVVGVLDHQFGVRTISRLPRLDRSWLTTIVAIVVGAASMAGIPLAAGFVAKDAVLDSFADVGGGGWWTVFVVAIAGSALTVAYSARFAWGALGRGAVVPVEPDVPAARPATLFIAPALVLVAVTVALGVAPQLEDRLIGASEAVLHPSAHGVHLAVWHGTTPALAGSVAALVVGALLFWQRHRFGRVLRIGSRLPDAGDVYAGALRGVNVLANRVTSFSQPGSLPVYAGVILTVAAVLPLWALTTGESWAGWPDLVDSPVHVPVAAVLIGSALAASVVRRRFSAALFLGVTGYAMAALFVVQGAPDLALTQVAIETLSTVLFVLVLWRMPDRFSWASARTPHGASHDAVDDVGTDGTTEHDSDVVMTRVQRSLRVGVAACVGVSVFVLAMIMTMTGSGDARPVSDWMIDNAEPQGHGQNIVNVILVDFRGFDTMGELTVLVSAAIGTVALARAGPYRGVPRSRRPLWTARSPASRSLASGSSGDSSVEHGADGAADRPSQRGDLRRFVTLDVSARVVFAAVMVGSIYLLFAGHNQPGGGFVGGIVAGAAVSLLYVAGGIDDVRRLSRARPWTVLGGGLLLSLLTAAAPLLVGDPILSNDYVAFDLAVLGDVKITSASVFDLGVYFTVLGLALMVFESFGDGPVHRTAGEQDGPGSDTPNAGGTSAGEVAGSSMETGGGDAADVRGARP